MNKVVGWEATRLAVLLSLATCIILSLLYDNVNKKHRFL